MNKEIIEKLKKNEKPFGLLSKEEQEVILRGPRQLYDGSGQWCDWGLGCVTSNTYRIKESYQPAKEPNKKYFIECEIYGDARDHFYFRFENKEHYLSVAINMPRFAGYFYPDGKARSFMPGWLLDGEVWQVEQEGSTIIRPTHVLFEK